MKKILIILCMAFTLNAHTQSVSGIAGLNTSGSTIFGMEFKTSSFGFFVERNFFHTNAKLIVANHTICGTVHDIKYDGVMLGVNYHIPSTNKITISGGIGRLNEFNFYYSDNSEYDIIERFAVQFTAGMELIKTEYINIAVRGGVNSCTLILGCVTIGLNLNTK